MRVAVAQFATSVNVQENLVTCLRLIDEAAQCQPSLIVLPEYSNTQLCYLQRSYSDYEQAWRDALTVDGEFLATIAKKAQKHSCYIVINVTLRRDAKREQLDSLTKSNISVTTCLFSPQGELVVQADKQNLLGYEKEFFVSTDQTAEVVSTKNAQLGLLVGSDDISFDASRELAINGAQIICHSMSSFAFDHSALYSPARASENNVFFVSANKVGALIPSEQNAELYTMQSVVPQEAIVAIGRSQIVSPEGQVLAKLDHNNEGFVFAELDVSEITKAGICNQIRPDGTEVFKQQRPELYQAVPQKNESSTLATTNVPVTANVAIFATYKSNEQAIEDVYHYIDQNLTDIIQLPELFFVADKTLTENAEQRVAIEELGKLFIEQVSSALRPFQYVCTSLILDGMHQAVIINERGLLAAQSQLHFCQRYQWTALGEQVNIIELPLEQGKIKLAMLTADDANVAEIVKVAAAKGIHVLLVPFDIQAPYEVALSLLSRAAENRICLVAASREKSFASPQPIVSDNPFGKNKVKKQKSTGLIINLTADPSVIPQWQSKTFDGYLNRPLIKYQHGKITKAVIHPIAACDKTLLS